MRDKDAVLTSVLVAKMAAHYKRQGKSLVHRLDELMAEHGCYLEGLRSYSFSGSVEAQRGGSSSPSSAKSPCERLQVSRWKLYGTTGAAYK